MRLIDTTVFIYLFVKSSKKDFEVAQNILQRVEQGEEASISLAVIYEVIDWLELQ